MNASENQQITNSDETRTFVVSLFRSLEDKTPKPDKWRWHRMKVRLTTFSEHASKKDAMLWSPARFRSGGERCAPDVTEVCALVLDLDKVESLDKPIDLLERLPYTSLLYSTFSHSDADPHCRIVMPLAVPVAAADWEFFHGEAAKWLAGMLGVPFDASCSDACRFYFLPSHGIRGDGIGHVFNEWDNRFLNPEPYIVDGRRQAETLEAERKARRAANTATFSTRSVAAVAPYLDAAIGDEIKRLERTVPGGQHTALNLCAFKVGQLLAGALRLDLQAGIEDAMLAVVLGWPCSLEPWTEREAARTVRDGFLAGSKNPRDLSHVGNDRAGGWAIPRVDVAFPVPRPLEDGAGGTIETDGSSLPNIYRGNGNEERSEPIPPKFPTITGIGGFLAETPNPVQWVVDGLLIAGGTSLLVARPKVGKSTLARDLAYCIVREEPFLGRRVTSGSVLMLAFEDHRDKLREELLAMKFREDDPISLHIGIKPIEAVENGTSWLADLVAFFRPALVVVDPLFKLLDIKDSNDYAELSAKLEPVNAIARQSGTHVMCLHHGGKSEREGGESVLGSTAIFAAVDTGLFMKRRSEGRVISSSQRYGVAIEETALSYDAVSGHVGLGETYKEIRTGSAESLVVDAIRSGATTSDEVRERLKMNRQFTQDGIKQALESGKVIRTGSGAASRLHLGGNHAES